MAGQPAGVRPHLFINEAVRANPETGGSPRPAPNLIDARQTRSSEHTRTGNGQRLWASACSRSPETQKWAFGRGRRAREAAPRAADTDFSGRRAPAPGGAQLNCTLSLRVLVMVGRTSLAALACEREFKFSHWPVALAVRLGAARDGSARFLSGGGARLPAHCRPAHSNSGP